MNRFFISDTHFGHYGMLKHESSSRPFKSIEEMDETMVRNWNSVVGKNDEVYILGDFSWHKNPERTLEILKQLHGKKYLVLGNHDEQIVKNKELRDQFIWVKDYYRLNVNGLKIILFHYPIQDWDCKFHGSIHLYGHVHSNKNNAMPLEIPGSYNVCADVNGLTPVSLEQIKKRLGVYAT